MHLAPEADLAVDLHDRNAVIEPRPVLRVSVDIDRLHGEAVGLQHLARVIAEMAAMAGIEDGGHRVLMQSLDVRGLSIARRLASGVVR